jgi:Glycosyl hydrolase family 92
MICFFDTKYLSGDEDNGEMGAWFVLSALGVFSTVPGDDYLVLGSPIFRHVRIWRGKCSKDGETSDCDYGERSSSNSSVEMPRSVRTRTSPRVFGFGRAKPSRGDELKGIAGVTYTFPSDSSYLHIVALGTAPDVSKVAEITFDGSPLGATDFGSPQLRRNTGAV